MGKKSVSNQIRQQIITLFQTGNYSNREIAKQLRVSPSCVDNAVKRMQQTGTPKERPRSGRPSKITPIFRRQLKRAVKKCRESRRKSLRALASQYSEATGSRLSHETVRRSLHSDHIHYYAATYRPTLKANHKEARLNWCRERSNWEPQRWDTVIRSDEYHFTVQPGKGVVRLWREPDEALHPDCIQPQDIGAGGGVTV
jgi:transposase